MRHAPAHEAEPERAEAERLDVRPRRGPDQGAGLRAFGLDVSYVRAEGSRVFAREAAGGVERAVWDFLGGYGSTFFGHNHPALAQAAVGFMERRGVVHGQASVRMESERLAAALVARLRSSLGRTYEIVLASTGSEAVEVAAKHAEEAWAARRDEAASWARSRPEPGPEAWSPAAAARLRAHGLDPGPQARALIARHNERLLARACTHVAARRSFHGMTARALSLTDDPEGRFGRAVRAPGVRFASADEPQDVARVLCDAQGTLLRPRRAGAWLALEERPFTALAGLYLEPIQGEGGIHPIAPAVARAWQAAARSHGAPLIADEIQCGLGRTGRFLHCESLGIRPDYVLLGKSLGGGLAKISAVAIAAEEFLPGFTLQHGSTFAGDELASCVALRALQLLDEEGALAAARDKGAFLLGGLRALAARHPRVIREVRGHGLMIGLEWRHSEFERSNALHDLRAYGWLGYALAGYLLRAHGIRVAPTLADRATLRLEPAYAVPYDALEEALQALGRLCALLEAQDAAAILAPGRQLDPAGGHARGAPLVRRAAAADPRLPHVGFVGHLIQPADLALWDRSFGRLDDAARARFLDRIEPVVEPVVTHRGQLTSLTGERTTLTFVGLAVPSSRFQGALRNGGRHELRRLVQRAVDLAAAEGCSVVGLGGYCSIVTRNGRELRPGGVGLTTGNGYTAAAALQAMRESANELRIDWRHARAAVVGATGNIGAVLAELLSAEVGSLVLLGRESRRAELEAQAGRLLWALAEREVHVPMARVLAEAGLPREALRLPDAARYGAVQAALGPACPIQVGSDAALCRGAQLVVAASNQASSVLFPEHLDDAPIVVTDLSVPADVDVSVQAARPGARIIRGGVVRAPRDPGWCVPGVPLPPGEMYACMAETVLMGLAGEVGHGSLGRLTPERVRATRELAARHGFTSVRTLVERSY